MNPNNDMGRDRQVILMILTNMRTDCVRLQLELLERRGELARFDRVVFLLNAPGARHMQFVQSVIARHPEARFDQIIGPGTRPDGISWMQNECVRKYPGAVYIKIDEDIFTPSGWIDRMLEVYGEFQADDRLGLISPLIPNNAMGLHQLLTRFYPEWLAEFRARFRQDPDPICYGFTWQSPVVAAWATRKFLCLDPANEEQRRRLAQAGGARYHRFPDRFSIGCICYDYRLWQKMGGIPRTDEPGWCQWILDHDHFNVMDCALIVLHYSFFIQQDWLDRTHLLEELRRANVPDGGAARYWRPWIMRLARQFPRAAARKARHWLGRPAG